MLDSLFDSLPAPLPSRAPAPPSYEDTIAGSYVSLPSPPPTNMGRYNKPGNNCFASNTKVLVVDPADSTTKTIPIEKLRTGHTVKTPRGRIKVVRIVLKCHTDQAKGRIIIVITANAAASLWVTP